MLIILFFILSVKTSPFFIFSNNIFQEAIFFELLIYVL